MPRPLIIANEAFERECARIGDYRYTSEYLLRPEDEARILRRELHNIKKFCVQNNTRTYSEVGLCACDRNSAVKCIYDVCRNASLYVLCPAECGPLCRNNPFYTNGFVGYQKGALALQRDRDIGLGMFTNVDIPKGEWIGPYLGEKKYQEDHSIDANRYTMAVGRCDMVIDAGQDGNFTRMINHSIVKENVKAQTFRFEDQLVNLFYSCVDIPAGNQLFLNYGYTEDFGEKWYLDTIQEAARAGMNVLEYRSVKKTTNAKKTKNAKTKKGKKKTKGATLATSDEDSDFDSKDEDEDEEVSGQNASRNNSVGCLSCLRCQNKKDKKAPAKRPEEVPLLAVPAKKAPANEIHKSVVKKNSEPRPGPSTDPDLTRITRSMSKSMIQTKKDK